MSDDMNPAALRALNAFVLCPLCGNIDATIEVETEPSDDPNYLTQLPEMRAVCSGCGTKTEWVPL